ncbi:hypothetical protein BLOT_003827, partial [Blomia tropicalis]
INMELLAHSKCPGKLILSGEHATVYGKNAVAITVDLYTEVKVFSSKERMVELCLRNFNFETNWTLNDLQQIGRIVDKDGKFVYNEQLLSVVKMRLKIPEEPNAVHNSCLAFLLLYLSISDISEPNGQRESIRVEVSSKMPNGAGLGSSSSYIVSLAKALFVVFNKTIEKQNFNQWCYEIDKLFHGKPSGIDNSICTYGGAILFGSGQIIDSIDSADLVDLAHTPVILVNTNVPRNTKNMVEKCRLRLTAYPTVIGNILDSIGHLSQNLWERLKSKDLSSLSVLFDMNQNLLNCLNVGHKKIDQIVAISHKYGLSAKLTGAGGGGIVLIYLSSNFDHNENLINELQLQGCTCYQVKLGVPGCNII